MFKKLLALCLSLLAATAFAAVDVNKATQADLESIKGIGPTIATKIIDERKKAPFKNWDDMVTRVKGVGEGNASRFSADGLTVNGARFAGAPAPKDTASKKTVAADGKAAAADAKADKRVAATDAKADKKAAASDAKADRKAAAAEVKSDKSVAATEVKADKKAVAAEVKADKQVVAVDAKAAKKAAAAEEKAPKKAAAAASAPKK